MKYRVLFAYLALTILSFSSLAEQVNIAVASNFTPAMKDIATAFEKETGHKAVLSFGSSGKFFAQILHGAPYDIFLSADVEKPDRLNKKGLGVTDGVFTYASGTLVLWSNRRTFKNLRAQFQRGNFNRLAVANPKLAPYGRAAQETLDTLHLTKKLTSNIVTGENISQTFHYVLTGNADMGMVALSQVIAEGNMHSDNVWKIPTTFYSPILQDAIWLERAADNAAAEAMFHYLRSEKAYRIMESYGYKTPQ